MTDLACRIRPGDRVCLKKIDPDFTGPFKKKKEAVKLTLDNLEQLREQQQRLYAEDRHALLIVLQAMDAAGKDGTIKHVMGAFNPQGVQVTSFKQPSRLELAHDFLWRVHAAAPRRGMIGIFNRSHYEEVLVVRVRELKPKKVWRRNYEHINNFERLLSDSGVTIVKIFLHISADEQAERFLERQNTPEKQWKFNPGDLEDRRLWPAFSEAYEDALTKCSTDEAPWWVVPANHKWFRNLAVSQILLDALQKIDPSYPKPVADIASYTIPKV